MNRTSSIDKLVRNLRNSDITAFNQLFEHYSSKLYHFAFGYLKSKEDTEELVQEVFIRIWEKRADIDPTRQFQSFLFTIAFNEVKKHFRTKNILEKYLEHARNNPTQYITHPEISYRELKERLDQLIEQLPQKRRLVFIKSRLEGKNAVEISEEMQISKKTVENHLNAALKFMRENLDHEQIVVNLFFYIQVF